MLNIRVICNLKLKSINARLVQLVELWRIVGELGYSFMQQSCYDDAYSVKPEHLSAILVNYDSDCIASAVSQIVLARRVDDYSIIEQIC